MMKIVSYILLVVFIKNVCFNVASSEQNYLRDQDVIFGVPQSFNNGIRGSRMGINDELLIELHETQNDTLWYRVGQTFGLRINWTLPYVIIDQGTNANVALNQLNQIVMVFESNDSLYYKTGLLLNNGQALLNEATVLEGFGRNPSIALTSNGTVLALYEVNSVLFIRIGFLHGTIINFIPAVKLADGINGSIVVNDKMEVVEMHYNSYTIFYTVGVIEGNNVVWGERKELQQGIEKSATVAINSNSQVFTTFKRNDHEVVNKVGMIDAATKTIEWLHERKLPFKIYSKCNIVANKEIAVLTLAGGITTSLIRDRKRWMELTSGVLNNSLRQLTLPGSHDAGAYSLSDFRVKEGCKKVPDFIPGILTKQYAETQNENIQEQLNNGVRYFDIRPYYWPQSEGGTNDFHIYHDNIGSRISRIMYLIKLFMESVQKEIVILRFSHFCSANFNDISGTYLHEKLSRLIKSILGDYIISISSQDGSFFKINLTDIVSSGPKILVVYDNDFALDKSRSASTFLRNRPYFDDYSNTDKLSVMQSDQLEKLKTNYGNEDRLFLLSYTLTWQLSTFSNPNANNLNDLSRNASKSLADYVDDNSDKYQINVIFVDFCAEARVTDVAIVANEKKFRKSFFEKI